MDISNKVVVVTGANRGIGEAVVRGLLQEGVAKIYATARNLASLPDFADDRVVPLQLDVTDRGAIQSFPALVPDCQILINNAGVAAFDSLVTGPEELVIRDMDVNYFGTVRVIRALTSTLLENKGEGDKSAIINLLSIVSLSSMAGAGGYCASKAALHSATQAIRQELEPKGMLVMGIYPGPIDTDMIADMDADKAPTSAVADAIIQGLKENSDMIFPDPMSAENGEIYLRNPKELEDRFASFL